MSFLFYVEGAACRRLFILRLCEGKFPTLQNAQLDASVQEAQRTQKFSRT
jgi:hypothetical protein